MKSMSLDPSPKNSHNPRDSAVWVPNNIGLCRERNKKRRGFLNTDMGGEDGGGILFNGYRVPVFQNEEFWRWMMVKVVQHCEYT